MCPTGRYPLPSSAAVFSPDLRPAFDILDFDRDGKISRDDLKSFYSEKSAAEDSIVAAVEDDVIGSMMSAADSDRDGFVEFSEFEGVLGRRVGSGLGIMEEVFRVMDRDGDGRVGFEDLKAYLELAGMGLGDEDVMAMIRMGGGDESQGIGLEALVEILAVDFAT